VKTLTPLPAELDIYHAAELRSHWLALLDEAAADCRLDGAAVDQVDGAGVQLLLALSRCLELRQRRLLVTDPSAPLRAACEALGVAHLLASATPAPGAQT